MQTEKKMRKQLGMGTLIQSELKCIEELDKSKPVYTGIIKNIDLDFHSLNINH